MGVIDGDTVGAKVGVIEIVGVMEGMCVVGRTVGECVGVCCTVGV